MIDGIIKLLPLSGSVGFGSGVDSQVSAVRVALLRAQSGETRCSHFLRAA